MADMYMARIEVEARLLQKEHRDILIDKLKNARERLLDALPPGSIVRIATVSQEDEIERTVTVVDRINKEIVV